MKKFITICVFVVACFAFSGCTLSGFSLKVDEANDGECLKVYDSEGKEIKVEK